MRFIRNLTILLLLALPSACGQAMQPAEHTLRFHILMSLDEFIETNRDAFREQLPSMDRTTWYQIVESRQAMGFKYEDPKKRFSLAFTAVGSPANPVRIEFSNSDTAAVGNVIASQYLEFALSDGKSLRQRIVEAVELQDKLLASGFKPVNSIQKHWKVQYGAVVMTDFRQLLNHLDVVEIDRGMELFTVHQDELVMAVALIKQAYTQDKDDYTLYFVIRQKTTGASGYDE
ncbi:MAG: hypothetical protein ACREXR_05705 [Gammaproteobacteria bacterium]